MALVMAAGNSAFPICCGDMPKHRLREYRVTRRWIPHIHRKFKPLAKMIGELLYVSWTEPKVLCSSSKKPSRKNRMAHSVLQLLDLQLACNPNSFKNTICRYLFNLDMLSYGYYEWMNRFYFWKGMEKRSEAKGHLAWRGFATRNVKTFSKQCHSE